MTATYEIQDKTGDCLVIDKLDSGNYAIYIRSFDKYDCSEELQELIDKAEFDGDKVTKEDINEHLDIALNISKVDLIKQLKAVVTQLQEGNND